MSLTEKRLAYRPFMLKLPVTISLYVKTHTVTGLKYFGKTKRKDVHGYTGSGVHWARHLAKHGCSYLTEVVATFETEDEAEAFAMAFSEEHDIVRSKEWANAIPENGRGGSPKGIFGDYKWVNKDGINKRTNVIQDGWSLGRYGYRPPQNIIERLVISGDKNAGRRCYTNGLKKGYFIEGQQPEGWYLGDPTAISEYSRTFNKDPNKHSVAGKKRYHNGFVERYFDGDPPEGWMPGSLIKRGRPKGSKDKVKRKART